MTGIEAAAALRAELPAVSSLIVTTFGRPGYVRRALDGSPVSRIAARAHLSGGTVRNHLSAAIGKTGATTRAEAARVAQSNGWL